MAAPRPSGASSLLGLALLLAPLALAPAAAEPAGGPPSTMVLEEAGRGAFEAWAHRPWDLGLPVTVLGKGRWQMPFEPTGHHCPVNVAGPHVMVMAGLEPGRAYEVLLYYGWSLTYVGQAHGLWDMGTFVAGPDGAARHAVDLGHYRPWWVRQDIPVYLTLWYEAPGGYRSAEWSWPTTGAASSCSEPPGGVGLTGGAQGPP